MPVSIRCFMFLETLLWPSPLLAPSCPWANGLPMSVRTFTQETGCIHAVRQAEVASVTLGSYSTPQAFGVRPSEMHLDRMERYG
jgi:hypothetical protein